MQTIYVFGITTDPGAGADATTAVCAKCQVQKGALFRSAYIGYDGLSGAGIVVVELVNNQFRLVRVHLGTHDHTSTSTVSLARSIHGHTAFCLICEIQRVPELLSLLNADDDHL